MAWVHAQLSKLQKGCTRLAAASDKVYLLLVRGRWFSPGTPASSTTKAGRHDIAEILMKMALKHQKNHSTQRRSCEIYTSFTGAVGISLSMCGQFIMATLKSYILSTCMLRHI